MRGCAILFLIAMAAGAQDAPVLAPGVPLRVMLERHVSIKKVGEPIQGRLVEPIFIYDRVVLPAGTTVQGHIAKIGGVPAGRRIAAILSGNFTPRERSAPSLTPFY